MKKSLLFLVLLLLLFQTMYVFSAKKEDKIKSYIKIAYKSGNRIAKTQMLDAIIKEFNSMKYTIEDEKFVSMIIFLTDEGSMRLDYNDKKEVINDFPDVRQKATRILGYLSGDSIKDALMGVLANDKNSQVKTEAVKALGNVKENVDQDILRAITFTYRDTKNPDPGFILEMIESLRKLALINPSLKQDTVYLLTEIQMGNFEKNIRTAAFKAIMELSK